MSVWESCFAGLGEVYSKHSLVTQDVPFRRERQLQFDRQAGTPTVRALGPCDRTFPCNPPRTCVQVLKLPRISRKTALAGAVVGGVLMGGAVMRWGHHNHRRG